MATTTELNMHYLLLVMKNAEIKPNYHALATEAGINSANNAQKKFKKIGENGGFALINNAIVSPPATPKTSKLAAPKLNAPKSKGATAARKSLPKVSPIALGMEIVAKNEAPAKKRKLQNKNDDDTEDCDVAKNVSESEVEV